MRFEQFEMSQTDMLSTKESIKLIMLMISKEQFKNYGRLKEMRFLLNLTEQRKRGNRKKSNSWLGDSIGCTTTKRCLRTQLDSVLNFLCVTTLGFCTDSQYSVEK